MAYKDRLWTAVLERGIELNPEKKYRVVDLEYELALYVIKNNPVLDTWGLRRRLEYEAPMLCYSYKDLKPEERESIINSPRWIAEPKIDGLRCVTCYHPQVGFEFFSREFSIENFLPNCYTNKILLIKNGIVRTPQSYVQYFPFNFVIDCEVVSTNKNLDTTAYGGNGVQTLTELNATTAILGSEPERAHALQIDQGGLKFYAFDIMYLGNKDLRDLPLEQRKEYLKKVVDYINATTPFELITVVQENKKEFYDHIVADGGEGVVLKNLDEKYHSCNARKRNVQVKMKRTMTEALNKEGEAQDIDAFISGFVPPTKSSSFQHLIGGVKVSVYLENEDGTEDEHFIGVVSGIPHKLKEEMTTINDKGKPELNPEFLGKVIAIDGQDVSAKNLRFAHCRAVDKKWNFRIDKNQYMCKLTRKFLESQVL